ncbi:MAG: ribonuclease P protein component [Candidatus Parabeggiatoa sp. nov. 3]|jgi:ribonuclease P protein component|nr:MAG: ribonuclease P protein component [Gammaproteobacteria bacterium]RKZ69689.1 MAG: ribonuclease P protein component [Gammaproteobacteria bacterium]RKZ89901.1 MAG: ribonuclease P protein component [Gammaproteobacteria bacterium]
MNNASFPFTREQRLLKHKQYKLVFDKPCKSSDQYLTVLARTNGVPQARLGLAIAKKRVKQAVERNRIKRLIRESFRHHQSCLAGLDCVVLAKTGIEQVNNRTLLHSLAKHWLKLSRRCKTS